MTSKRNLFTKQAWSTPKTHNTPEPSQAGLTMEAKDDHVIPATLFYRSPTPEQYGQLPVATEEDHRKAREFIKKNDGRCNIL